MKMHVNKVPNPENKMKNSDTATEEILENHPSQCFSSKYRKMRVHKKYMENRDKGKAGCPNTLTALPCLSMHRSVSE